MTRWLEYLLTLGGAVVLVACTGALMWREWHAASLVLDFERERRAASVTRMQAPPATPAIERLPGDRVPDLAAVLTPVSLDRHALSSAAPDQSDWSQARKRAFHAPQRDLVGVMRIDDIGIEVPILPGSDDGALDAGVGWLTRTAFPGDIGNVAIAGHRDSFFRRLGRLGPGDVVTIETLNGQYDYRVTGHSIVKPDDVHVLDAVPGRRLLTLITCYPFRYVGSAPERYIVHAELADETA